MAGSAALSRASSADALPTFQKRLNSPIQTESVAYISSRSELLAATFYIAALWVFASGLREKRPWVTAFLLVFLLICSLLCKQDKLTLPFVILLMDYLLLSGCDWRRMKLNWRTYALFLGGMIAGLSVILKPLLLAQSAGFSLPWPEYLFTQFRMWFLYLTRDGYLLDSGDPKM